MMDMMRAMLAVHCRYGYTLAVPSQGSQPRNTEKNHVERAQGEGAKTNQNCAVNTGVTSPDVTQLRPSPREIDVPGHAQQSANPPPSTWEKVGIGTGIIGVLVLIFQSCQLVKSTTAAVNQARAAGSQLKEMRKQRKTDMRAWVFAEVFQPDNMPNSFMAVFKNTGKTPGLKVLSIVGPTQDLKTIPNADNKPTNSGFSGLIPPVGESVKIPIPIPTEYIVGLLNKVPFYCSAIVWYDDVFGTSHWSRCTIIVKPDKSTAFAAIGNDCDTEQPDQ